MASLLIRRIRTFTGYFITQPPRCRTDAAIGLTNFLVFPWECRESSLGRGHLAGLEVDPHDIADVSTSFAVL